MKSIDHPIFIESLRYIQARLNTSSMDVLEKQVLERIIHSSGDFSIQKDLKFSSQACQRGMAALRAGAPILTDTFMAAAAVTPMASRTLETSVYCALDWTSSQENAALPRTAIGIERAWVDLSKKVDKSIAPIVLFGSAPKALESLLKLVSNGAASPSLIIGMPVGFIRVLESKKMLANTDLPQIRIDGNRGGAAMAAATVNALLRASI